MGATASIGAGLGAGSLVLGLIAQDRQRSAAHTAQDRLKRQLNNPPPIMPTADDAAVSAARKRSLYEQVARRGRQSTFLTPDTGDTLG